MYNNDKTLKNNAINFNDQSLSVNTDSLKSNEVSIGGIMLQKLNVQLFSFLWKFHLISFYNKDSKSPSLVNINSTNNNMRKIALAVLNNYSIMLEGPTGSGKTTLVEELASITGQKLFKYQIDEYMDSKVILLNLTCY